MGCEARTGFYGDDVCVMEIDLEDDPDEKKSFDAGKPNVQSKCADKSVPLKARFAGDALSHFTAVSKAMEETIASGGHTLVHCHASLSRSVAFILAHLMRTRGLTLLEAAAIMKPKWNAVWPCDRFTDQLIAYEKELAKPYQYSSGGLAAALTSAFVAGAGLAIVAVM